MFPRAVMTRSSARAALCFAATVLLIAGSGTAAGPALAAQPAVARETQATPSPTPTVEVLAPGKAPLEQLRLSPPVGTSQRSSMTVSFAVQQSGVSSASVKPPPTKATVVTTLQGMTPEGNLQISFSYPSFEILKGGDASKSQRQRIQQAFSGLTGLSGQLTVTPQGVLVDSTLNVPPNLDSSVSSLVTQLGFPADSVQQTSDRHWTFVGRPSQAVLDGLGSPSYKMHQPQPLTSTSKTPPGPPSLPPSI